MAWPQTPHLSRPVSRVGEDTRRGGILFGARASRLALTRSKVDALTPIRLFELIVENMEKPEEQFDALVREHIEDTAASERILEKAPTFKQKLTRLRKEVMNTSTLTALLGGAASAFGG